MSPYEMNAAISAYASLLASSMTSREIAFWAVVLSHLGANLASIAALQQLHQTGEGALTATEDAAEQELSTE